MVYLLQDNAMSEVSLSSAIQRGLRQDSREGNTGAAFETCYGVKPTPFGLREQETMVDFVDTIDGSAYDSLSISKAHPFPQVFKGKEVTILADESAIYLFSSDAGPRAPIRLRKGGPTPEILEALGRGEPVPGTGPSGIFEFLRLYDIFDLEEEETAGITSGGPWQFVDFHSTWFLLNGETVVMKTPRSIKTFAQSAVRMNTACSFRGRMIFGGIDQTYWFHGEDDSRGWLEKWGNLVATGTGFGAELANPAVNWVGWSTIGGSDLLHVYRPDLALTTPSLYPELSEVYSESDPYLAHLMKRGEAGFIPMPWQGEVMVVKELAKRVIVYGEDGVSALFPVADPIPTFGLEENVLAEGIMDRGAVGGDDREHIFIDKEGVLWRLSESDGIERLGYEEHFSLFADNYITISLDPTMREYYITGTDDGTVRTFLLNRNGLTESKKLVISALRHEGQLSTVFTNQTTPSESFQTKTFPLSVPDGSVRTLSKIHIRLGEIVSPELITVSMNVRNSLNEDSSETVSGTLNRFGDVYLNGTGVYFEITVESTGVGNLELDDITLTFAERHRDNLKDRMS